MTSTPRTPGEPVAWASEWMGLAPSRALHDCKHEAADNAKWMGGGVVPLIPASDLSQAIKERDEAVRLASEMADLLALATTPEPPRQINSMYEGKG